MSMTIFFVIEKQDNNFFLLFPVVITKLDMFNVNFASFFVLFNYIFIAIKYPYDMGFACALI